MWLENSVDVLMWRFDEPQETCYDMPFRSRLSADVCDRIPSGKLRCADVWLPTLRWQADALGNFAVHVNFEDSDLK